MFEEATRRKFRFETAQGSLTTEDLWDLSLTTESQAYSCLNDIAVNLSARIRTIPDEDFVNDAPKRDRILEQKLALVVHIIQVKKAELLASKTRIENKAKNARIREVIDMKGDSALQKKSIKALEEMLLPE